MKKLVILPFLSSILSGSVLSLATSNLNTNTLLKIKSNLTDDNTWEGIGISHNVTTPGSGTHDIKDEKNSITASDISWSSIISVDNTVHAVGGFYLHTYKQPKDHGYLDLKLSSSDSITRIWKVSEVNTQKTGWAHQTSEINLTLTAKHNTTNDSVALEMYSSIRAYTRGSVHACSTTSEIFSAEFINM